MKKFLLTALSVFACTALHAQTNANEPKVLEEGDNQVAIDWNNFRQTYYFVYTSQEDQLLTLNIPTENATVVASSSAGDKIDSDIYHLIVPDNLSGTTVFKCLAPKGSPVYLKISIQTWAMEADTESVSIIATPEPYEIKYGLDISDPLEVSETHPVFLPLKGDPEPPFNLIPVYVAFTAPHSGFLYLNFAPSVTQIDYTDSADGTFTYLEHDYIMSNGKTVGARALLEVEKDDYFIFRITGFNASMMSTTIENPEPGTSCDFPLELVPGEVTLPAAAGDYYWSFTPEKEGFIEVTSDDIQLPDGLVQVMMDGQGTGAFTIYSELRMRAWVYDRMEYLLHISKPIATDSEQKFNAILTEPQACDLRFDPQPMAPGETYRTIPFSGTYYYSIKTPAIGESKIKLTTLELPKNSDTRVNLYAADAIGETLARGFDLTYDAEADTEYVLQWTVFDNDMAIPFIVEIDRTNSIEDIKTASVTSANLEIYELDGKYAGSSIGSLDPGVYIVKEGDKIYKITK